MRYHRRMDKDFAVKKAGGEPKLAALLGISKQAVNQWGPHLPQLQVYRLREIRPKWFAEWRRLQNPAESATVPGALDEAKAA